MTPGGGNVQVLPGKNPGPPGSGNTQSPLQGSGTPNPAAQAKPSKSPPAPNTQPGIAPNQYISIYAEDYANSSHHTHINVLAGDTAPTLTGGIAKQTIVNRPLRRGLTIFTGYDPVALQVALRFIRFDGPPGTRVLEDDASAARNEHDIQQLEWMSGYHFMQGPPPLVWLATYSNRGGDSTSPLIPPGYQSYIGPREPGGQKFTVPLPGAFGFGDGPPWLVQDIQWDASPYRNRNGYRIRQDVTVTFLAYTSVDPSTSAASRNNPANKGKSYRFVATAAANTPLKIAQTVGARDPGALARAIIALSKNWGLHEGNKWQHLRSINAVLKPGTVVWIPYNYG